MEFLEIIKSISLNKSALECFFYRRIDFFARLFHRQKIFSQYLVLSGNARTRIDAFTYRTFIFENSRRISRQRTRRR